MNKILALQKLDALGIERTDEGDAGSDCSYIGCNTISTSSENNCSNYHEVVAIN